MQLSAVLLARAFLFLESNDLNPRGAASYPDVVRALVDRYSFQKFPQKFEDFDESKGVEFALGQIGGRTIERVMIYSNGISLDTTSSTTDSEAILEDALVWSSANLGLSYSREMIKRRVYVSQVTFYSDANLLMNINPILRNLSEKVTKAVASHLNLKVSYEPSGISLAQDPGEQKLPTSGFTIERRLSVPFSDKKYFSAAPLPTDVHIGLVEEFERAVLR